MQGAILVILAAFFWAIAGTVAKLIFNNDVSPFLLVQARLTLSALILGMVLWIKSPNLLKLNTKKDFWSLMVLGIFGMSAVSFLYLNTISLTNVAIAIFLQYLAPVLVALYLVIFAGHRLQVNTVIGLLLAVLGSLGILLGNLDGGLAVSPMGLASGLGSACAYAFYTVYGQKMVSRLNSWTVLFYALLFGAVFWLLVLPPWTMGYDQLSTEIFGFILFIGLFATVVPFGLYFLGLTHIEATKAGIIATIEPVIAGIASYFLLNETLSPLQIVGSSLILLTVIILQLDFSTKIGGLQND